MVKKIKENLDVVKGERSYTKVINEILEGTFNFENRSDRLPLNEVVISYLREFEEAEEREKVMSLREFRFTG